MLIMLAEQNSFCMAPNIFIIEKLCFLSLIKVPKVSIVLVLEM